MLFINDSAYMSKFILGEEVRSMSSFILPGNSERCIVAVFIKELPVAVVCNVFSDIPEEATMEIPGTVKVG